MTTASCIAMNPENQHIIFREITAVKTPQKALFVTNDYAIVNGTHGCSVINPKTNTILKTICGRTWQDFALNPKKTKIALYNTDELRVFDIQTGNEEWKIDNFPTITSAIFDHGDAIILTMERTPCDSIIHNVCPYGIVKMNYKKNTCIKKLFDKKFALFLHPTKEYLYQTHLEYPAISMLDNELKQEKKIGLQCCSHFDHHPQESLIIVSDSFNFWLLHTDLHHSVGFPLDLDLTLHAIQFHPNGLYIAILFTKQHQNTKKFYLNYLTKSLIFTHRQMLIPDNCDTVKNNDPDSSIKSYLSFSPDGKNVLITTPDAYFMGPVPFDIVYHDNTKEKSAFIYWFLKNYYIDENTILPEDMKQFITHVFLETCKR